MSRQGFDPSLPSLDPASVWPATLELRLAHLGKLRLGLGLRVVLNTVKIANDVPALAEILDKYTVVSPRTKDRPSGSGHAVMAPWVVDEALALAEDLASPGGGLLVIVSDPEDEAVQAWIARTKATRLI